MNKIPGGKKIKSSKNLQFDEWIKKNKKSRIEEIKQESQLNKSEWRRYKHNHNTETVNKKSLQVGKPQKRELAIAERKISKIKTYLLLTNMMV